MCALPRCTCSRASFPPPMLMPSNITSWTRLAWEASLAPRETLHMQVVNPDSVEVIDGFIDLDEAGLEAFLSERGLAMDLADIAFFQSYFQKKRAATPPLPKSRLSTRTGPTTCRHTTFGTELTDIAVDRRRCMRLLPSTNTWPCVAELWAASDKPVCLHRHGHHWREVPQGQGHPEESRRVSRKSTPAR